LAASVASAASLFGSSPVEATPDQSELFPFLAGAAPYFEYPLGSDYYKIDTAIPDTCTLKQVQVFARHGERFPSASSGNKLINLYNTKFANLTKDTLIDNEYFSFLLDPTYEFFLPDNSTLNLETTTENSITGPLNIYSGENTALKFGAEFVEKYAELIGDELPIFASSNTRVYDTAVNFGKSVEQYTNSTVNVQILSEIEEEGANCLTPAASCQTWDDEEGADIVDAFDTTYLDELAERLNNATTGLNLTSSDANLLFSWCAYEINAAGYSPICEVFNQKELILHAYYDDLTSFYSDGPGNSVIKPIGSVLFNASTALLKDPPAEYSAYIGFTHDTDLQNMMAAVGLFDTGVMMNSTFEYRNTVYKKSWMTPMGARFVLENYECGNSSYVRYLINDAVVTVPNCSSGPGFSCEINDYYQYTEDRMSNITDYVTACNVTAGLPSSVSFYWDWETKNYTAPLNVASY
ncbi:hypothetical protein HANVADRAFT_54425, partial [Hanseniaspora valbyensis NRRL Y-1626]